MIRFDRVQNIKLKRINNELLRNSMIESRIVEFFYGGFPAARRISDGKIVTLTNNRDRTFYRNLVESSWVNTRRGPSSSISNLMFFRSKESLLSFINSENVEMKPRWVLKTTEYESIDSTYINLFFE